MESKARYLLVGIFSLLSIALAVVLITWMDDDNDQADRLVYPVMFRESISGLSLGSEVRYLGVPVGTVVDFNLQPGPPPTVEVSIAVDERARINANTKAELQLQGITGLAIIELSPGSEIQDEPPADPEEIILQGTGTLLSRLAVSTDDITRDLGMVLRKADKLLSEDNLRSTRRILKNIDAASANFETLVGKFDVLLVDLLATNAELQTTLREFGGLANTAEQQLLPDIESAFRSIEKASIQLSATFEDKNVDQVLRSVNAMSDQFIVTLAEIETLMERLQQHPESFLYLQEEHGLELAR